MELTSDNSHNRKRITQSEYRSNGITTFYGVSG